MCCRITGYATGTGVGAWMAIHKKMNKESIWKLLARKMAGEATEEELRELKDLLTNDPGMKYIAETFSRLWSRSGEDKQIDSSFS
jgi:hypothetical protein